MNEVKLYHDDCLGALIKELTEENRNIVAKIIAIEDKEKDGE